MSALGLAACAAQRAKPLSQQAPTLDPLSEERQASESLVVPEEYRAAGVSAELGAAYFERYGVGDPYGAGIPYPLFLALMRAYPERLGNDFEAFSRRFGTIYPNPDAKAEPGLPVGFHVTRDPLTGTPFLMMNCQICHAAELNTRSGKLYVPGLGNKRLRIHEYDLELTRVALDPGFTSERLLPLAVAEARKLGLSWRVDLRRAVVRQTLRKMRERAVVRRVGVERLAGGLPGRVAPIDAFIIELNRRYDAKLRQPDVPSWVKIPDVAPWRYRATNSFDGATVGSPVALVAEADFGFGVRHEWYKDNPHIPTSIFLYLKAFDRVLPYPAPIDQKLARTGSAVFDDKCAVCHGRYAPEQRERAWVSYDERLILKDIVGTDAARLEAVTPEFVTLVNSLPQTRGLLFTRRTESYVPRPLVNLWARAPYGHNGQWPDLETLALPPERRPKQFVVDLAAPYNAKALGLAWREAAAADPDGGYRYDASQPGFGVQGHPFLAELAQEQKAALFEFLKLL